MNKTWIKSLIAIIGANYICFIIQTGIFSRFELAGVTPNLILVLTSLCGFMLGAKFGMITGFVGGMVLDFFSGGSFGTFSLMYLYIGFINGSLSSIYYGDDIKLPVFLVGASDFLYGMVIYGINYLMKGRGDTAYYISNVIMPEVVYTMLVSMVMYFPVKRLLGWVSQPEKGRNAS